MNKKTIIILAIIILAIAGIGGGSYLVKQRQEIRKKAVPATTITLQPATTEAEIGETVSFDILVNTGANSLAFVRLDIDYDQSALQATSLTFSSLLPKIFRSIDITSQSGKVTGSAGASTGVPISGTGQKVASLSFKVLSAAPSGTTISFGTNTLAGSATTEDKSTNLIIRKNPAKIVIAALLEPTPTPTTTPTIIPTATPTDIPVSTPTNTLAPTTSDSTGGEISPTATQSAEGELPTTGKTTPTFLLFIGGVILTLSALLII